MIVGTEGRGTGEGEVVGSGITKKEKDGRDAGRRGAAIIGEEEEGEEAELKSICL